MACPPGYLSTSAFVRRIWAAIFVDRYRQQVRFEITPNSTPKCCNCLWILKQCALQSPFPSMSEWQGTAPLSHLGSSPPLRLLPGFSSLPHGRNLDPPVKEAMKWDVESHLKHMNKWDPYCVHFDVSSLGLNELFINVTSITSHLVQQINKD